MSEDPMQGLDAINVEAHRGRRGKSPAPRNNPPAPTLITQETTMSNNNNVAPVAPIAPVKPGFAYHLDTGLSVADKVGGFIGQLMLPGAAGAGMGFGIVKLAGDKLPAKYAVPVVLVSAFVMIAGKVIIHEVAKGAVMKSGNITAHARWDIARAERYIDAARKAGISEERIFAHLKAAGAPVAETASAPQVVAAAG